MYIYIFNLFPWLDSQSTIRFGLIRRFTSIQWFAWTHHQNWRFSDTSHPLARPVRAAPRGYAGDPRSCSGSYCQCASTGDAYLRIIELKRIFELNRIVENESDHRNNSNIYIYISHLSDLYIYIYQMNFDDSKSSRRRIPIQIQWSASTGDIYLRIIELKWIFELN